MPNFFLQNFLELCVCIFYALSLTIFLVIFFQTSFWPFFGQIFGKLETHSTLVTKEIETLKIHLKKVRYAIICYVKCS